MNYTIEIFYLIAISLVTLFIILAVTRKMSIGIALVSIFTGVIVAWIFAPYTILIMKPLGNALIYGYAWGVFEVMALYNIIIISALILIRAYNLSQSGGKIGWA